MVVIRKKDHGIGKTKPLANDITLVSFILDESGSMEQVKAAAISGFNEYIQTLKEKISDVHITFAKFNSDRGVQIVFANKPISDVKEFKDENYNPNGMTPLYDAIGQTVHEIEKASANKILFVIQTDGFENASEEYTLSTIKAIIKEKEDKGNWTFIYLGADQDAWEKGGIGLGLHKDNVLSYDGDNTIGAFIDLATETVNFCSDETSSTRKFFGR